MAPSASLIAHRGAFIALGAVGISLGAVYAWRRTKRPAVEAPSSILEEKKKPSKERRNRSKRQRSRQQQPAPSGVHESSEEDFVGANSDPTSSCPEAHAPVADVTVDASEMDAHAMADLRLSPTDARSSAQADLLAPPPSAEGVGIAPADRELSAVGGWESAGETGSEGTWIPVERKKGKSKRSAVVPAANPLSDLSTELKVHEMPEAVERTSESCEEAEPVLAQASLSHLLFFVSMLIPASTFPPPYLMLRPCHNTHNLDVQPHDTCLCCGFKFSSRHFIACAEVATTCYIVTRHTRQLMDAPHRGTTIMHTRNRRILRCSSLRAP